VRPSSNWEQVAPDVARYLHEHGVRTKRVLAENKCFYVFLVPSWARTFHRRYLLVPEHAQHGLMRRALRRAARDADFREAFLAAATVRMEREFLAAQEQKLDG
jgi:hypothetical protein